MKSSAMDNSPADEEQEEAEAAEITPLAGKAGSNRKDQGADTKRNGAVFVNSRHQETALNQALFRRVIFPENKWIKQWDALVLVALFLLTFILPYQIGVSGGFLILSSIPWLVFNLSLIHI